MQICRNISGTENKTENKVCLESLFSQTFPVSIAGTPQTACYSTTANLQKPFYRLDLIVYSQWQTI